MIGYRLTRGSVVSGKTMFRNIIASLIAPVPFYVLLQVSIILISDKFIGTELSYLYFGIFYLSWAILIALPRLILNFYKPVFLNWIVHWVIASAIFYGISIFSGRSFENIQISFQENFGGFVFRFSFVLICLGMAIITFRRAKREFSKHDKHLL